jgi:hypothetical protein
MSVNSSSAIFVRKGGLHSGFQLCGGFGRISWKTSLPSL